MHVMKIPAILKGSEELETVALVSWDPGRRLDRTEGRPGKAQKFAVVS